MVARGCQRFNDIAADASTICLGMKREWEVGREGWFDGQKREYLDKEFWYDYRVELYFRKLISWDFLGKFGNNVEERSSRLERDDQNGSS